MKKILLSFACLAIVSACATVMHGPYQEITVHTPGALESICYLDNKTIKYKVAPPQAHRIQTSRHNLEVRCLADGNREKTIIVESDWSRYVAGNLATGIIPAIVDFESGSAHRYSAIVTVDFTNMPRRSMGEPVYQEYARRRPDLTGIEEFRVGMPALQSDFYKPRQELERIVYEDAFESQDNFVVLDENGVPIGEADMKNVGSSTGAPVVLARPKSDVEDLGSDKSQLSEGYDSIDDTAPSASVSTTTTTRITPVTPKVRAPSRVTSSAPKTAVEGAAELMGDSGAPSVSTGEGSTLESSDPASSSAF